MVALLREQELEYHELITRRDRLVQRLSAGWRRIDQAIAEGKDVRAWEEHWLALLGEYERTCDLLRQCRSQ